MNTMTQRTALLSLLALSACVTLSGPTKAAQSAAQKAYALQGTYNVLLGDVAAVVQNPATDQATKAALQRIVRANSGIMDQLDAAARQAAVERAKFEAGQSSTEKLAVVAENVDKWYPQAETALTSLKAALHPN